MTLNHQAIWGVTKYKRIPRNFLIPKITKQRITIKEIEIVLGLLELNNKLSQERLPVVNKTEIPLWTMTTQSLLTTRSCLRIKQCSKEVGALYSNLELKSKYLVKRLTLSSHHLLCPLFRLAISHHQSRLEINFIGWVVNKTHTYRAKMRQGQVAKVKAFKKILPLRIFSLCFKRRRKMLYKMLSSN